MDSDVGTKLRKLRSKSGLGSRAVQELSRQLSTAKRNSEFYISNAWLSEIEHRNKIPSLYKLYTLSVLYQVEYERLLTWYGLSLAELTNDQISFNVVRTHLVPLRLHVESDFNAFPEGPPASEHKRKTYLYPLIVRPRENNPASLLSNSNHLQYTYGYVGADDCMLHPLIPPGSFVQIDQSQKKIQSPPWTSLYERPIYFFELRDGYRCAWCQPEASHLVLVPHPESRHKIRRMKYPDDVEVVGRVVGITIRIETNLAYTQNIYSMCHETKTPLPSSEQR